MLSVAVLSAVLSNVFDGAAVTGPPPLLTYFPATMPPDQARRVAMTPEGPKVHANGTWIPLEDHLAAIARCIAIAEGLDPSVAQAIRDELELPPPIPARSVPASQAALGIGPTLSALRKHV